MEKAFTMISVVFFIACTVMFLVSYITDAPMRELVFWGVATLLNQAAFHYETKDD